ncbi:MAG: murein biosynthesis integral membrane protein MurJ [Planctomycetes bacterium]|nr:murein biosynthesis integral membrane protein MurJ [Planctomycetota bacterium]
MPEKHSDKAKEATVAGSAKIISACIMLSRVLGFIRDMLFTTFFGWIGDAFFFAFMIPNLFRKLFGEGALSSAFIPTFSDYIHNKERTEMQRFLNIIITTLTIFLMVISAVIVAISFLIPDMANMFPSQKDPGFYPLFASLLRIMIPYMPIICLVALLTAILNSLKHFAMPALASVVLNISWIAAFLVAPLFTPAPEKQVVVIAWGIIIGGLLELVMQIPSLIKRKIGYKPQVDFKNEGFKKILKLMGPATFGLAIVQINLMVDVIIARAFVREDGAISALYFSNRIMQLPLAIIGISMAIAVFPFLAEYISKKNICGMKQDLAKSLRLTMFIAIPASIGLVVLCVPVVDLVYNILPKFLFHGKGLDNAAVTRTAAALACYAIGIWAYGGLQIINRAFYAFNDMKTPVKIGAMMVMMNVVLNLILVQYMQEAGIALATAITALANFFTLFYLLEKKTCTGETEVFGKWQRAEFSKSFISGFIIALIMGAGCYFMLLAMPEPIDKIEILWVGLMKVIIPVTGGVILYMLISLVFARENFKEFWVNAGLKRKARKNK